MKDLFHGSVYDINEIDKRLKEIIQDDSRQGI